MRREREQNQIVVAAIDGFSDSQGMTLLEAALIFKQYGVSDVLRDNYDILHTQDLFEGARFASDYLFKVSNGQYGSVPRD
jgi:hypothetical protein